MRAQAVSALASLVLLAPSAALAHIGLEPQSIDAVLVPGDDSAPHLETSFSYFVPQGGSYGFSCHEALLADAGNAGNQLPRYVRTSGAVLVTLRSLGLGLDPNVDVYRSTDETCNWSAVSGLDGVTVSQLAVLGDGSTVLAAGTSGGLFRSTDGGATFVAAPGMPAGHLALSVVAGPGSNAWASSLSASGSAILTSSDGGASWTSAAVPFEGDVDDVRILMTDPANAANAWISVTSDNLNHLVAVSDGASNGDVLLSDGRDLKDGVVDASGAWVILGASRPYFADDGANFTQRTDLPLSEGVAVQGDDLLLAAVVSSGADLWTWDGELTQSLSMQDFGNLTCPAGSRHEEICTPLWDEQAEGILGLLRGSGDDDDSAGDDDDSGECNEGCCCASVAASSPSPLLVLLLVPLLVRRRR